jgi:hypothetical protein
MTTDVIQTKVKLKKGNPKRRKCHKCGITIYNRSKQAKYCLGCFVRNG